MVLTHWPFEPTPDSPEWNPAARRGDKQETRRKKEEDPKYFKDMVHYADKMVGRILEKLEGLQVPSSAMKGGKNLVIFPENLASSSTFAVDRADELPKNVE